jgi:dihydrofolate reductase
MTGQEVVFVVARATNGVIGRDNALPWRIPADLRRFKALTAGYPMIMGRRTFDSLGGLLPGRRHIVLTRDPQWHAAGVDVVATADEAIAQARAERVSVIGGAEIFALFLNRADRVELTEVHAEPEGDIRMPAFEGGWRESARTDHPGENGQPAYSFVSLVRAP